MFQLVEVISPSPILWLDLVPQLDAHIQGCHFGPMSNGPWSGDIPLLDLVRVVIPDLRKGNDDEYGSEWESRLAFLKRGDIPGCGGVRGDA